MTRILFWLALAFLVLMALRSKFKSVPPPGRHPGPGAGSGPLRKPAAPQAAEAMLACAHCGIYYPASETVQAKGHDYCSDAHASLP